MAGTLKLRFQPLLLLPSLYDRIRATLRKTLTTYDPAPVQRYALNESVNTYEGQGKGRLALNEMAAQIYGKKYVAQQTGDMLPNNSVHEYDFSTEDDVEEETYYADEFDSWQAMKEEDYDYDFQVYREAPEPGYMIARLIADGHLPHGIYLLYVSW